MPMAKLTTVCALLVALSAAPAHSGVYTYSEWERLSDSRRAAYIAGAFDAYVGLFTRDPGEMQLKKHYGQCISGSRMTDQQLADNVLRFGRSHPEVQNESMMPALFGYF